MIKKLLILLITFLTITDIAFCYSLYSPSSYVYYSVGRFENLSKRKHTMYNTGREYNRDTSNYNTYYCYIPDNSDTGYLLERTRYGAVGYVWQNDGYMQVSRQRCHRTLDTYPVVKNFKQAKQYKN